MHWRLLCQYWTKEINEIWKQHIKPASRRNRNIAKKKLIWIKNPYHNGNMRPNVFISEFFCTFNEELVLSYITSKYNYYSYPKIWQRY